MTSSVKVTKSLSPNCLISGYKESKRSCRRKLYRCSVTVLNSMFCLNCDCVLCTHSHRYIGNIVISKIVISGFCPIQFTVIFAGT